jgi:hypothetical protein
VPTYSQQDFGRIAAALGVNAAKIRQYGSEFEEAATWYRLKIPPSTREGGPILELRNQRPQKSKNPSELCKHCSKKPKTHFELGKKAKQVEAAARKLLLRLGVRRLDQAPDGPGDGELLTFLAAFSGSSEEEIIYATARGGRLAELLEAIDATKCLEACSYKAAQEAAKFAKLIPKGHQGDVAAIGWSADMMSLYKRITGKEPRFSILRPGSGRGKPGGRFLRFLMAAGEPLEIELSPATARSRQRAVRRPAKRSQK